MLEPSDTSLRGGVSVLGNKDRHSLNPSVVSTKCYTAPHVPLAYSQGHGSNRVG